MERAGQGGMPGAQHVLYLARCSHFAKNKMGEKDNFSSVYIFWQISVWVYSPKLDKFDETELIF